MLFLVTSLLVPRAVAWAQADLAAQVDAARLDGTVSDSASSRPLPGALITLVRLGRAVSAGENGHYAFSGLPRDTLTLSVRVMGYAPRTLRVDLTQGDRHLDVALVASAIQLDNVTVTGQSTAQDALHKERATTLMSADEVQRGRGQTLGETIQQVPGVAIIQFGPSIAKPVVRGLHSQRLRVMNGDVPQEGQQWGEEHAPEIDAFAANEIEVIRGSGFVLYGSDAIAGVVRILPRPLPQAGVLGGEATMNLFSNNRQGAGSLLLEGADLTLPVIGRLGWRAQVSSRRAGDASTSDYYLQNTGFEERNFNLALGTTRGWGGTQLAYSRFSTDLGMYLGAHVSTVTDLERAMRDPLKSDSFSYDIARPNQSVSHDLVSWRTNVSLGRAAMLDVGYGYQHNHRAEYDGIGFASGSTRPAFGLELYTHSLDVRLHHAPLGHLAGTLGVSGMRQGNLSPGRSFLIPQYRIYSGGIYGLEQLALGRWTMSAGLRYDYRWQHAFQFGDPVIISPEERRSWDGPSGSLGASFEFAPGWSIASTVGRAWRAPNVSERFSAGVHHGTAQYQLGDTSITTERSLSVDATVRHAGRSLRLELSAYNNQIDGYIYLRPFGDVATVRGAYPGYMFAQTNARLRGLEASMQWAPATWWSLYLSGTLVRGRDRTTGDVLFDIPADRLVANVRLTSSGGARVTAPYLELGTTLVRKQDHVPPNTVYMLPTAGYALFNVELGAASLNLLGRPLELSLGARNVFGTAHRDYLSRYRLFVDDAGRDVVLRITTAFGGTRPRSQ
jgi:iron complex outermembrane receptor protein